MPGPGGPGNDVIMEQELQVDPTIPNEIEVVAYNGKGLLATEPLRMSFAPVQRAVQQARKLYVLTVGVNEYNRPDWRLRYAAGDA